MKRVGALLLCSCLVASLAWAADPPKAAPAKGAAAPAKGAPDAGKKAPAAPAAPAAGEGKSPFKSELEKRSYAIGLDMGKGMSGAKIELAIEQFVKGLRDGLGQNKEKPLLDEAGMRAAIEEFQKDLAMKAEEKAVGDAKANKDAGDAFLAANAKKEGVKSTASGLQYKVVKSGKGKSPKPTDTVRVHYSGKLLDGTTFDSSYDRNEPAEFPVGRVIPGWTEALQLMKPGDKWQIFIPSELGYGARGTGRGGPIGPNATLVFDVELLEILAGEAEAVPGKEDK